MSDYVEPNSTPIAKVLKALGLDGKYVERLIIDIKADNLVKVYSQQFINSDACEALAELIDQSKVEKAVARKVDIDFGEVVPAIVCDMEKPE